MEGRPLTELIEKAKRGDSEAYEVLVREHQDVAFRVAYLIAGNASDAEDAAQEGFIKAYFALPRFKTGAPFKPWLLAIVANEARTRRRSGARREALVTRLAEGRSDGDAAPSPEGATLAQEDREMLVTAMEQLNERDRLVIGFRYLLDLNEKEMAAALGVRAGTVKSRLSRAMAKLRRVIEEGAS